MTFLKVVRAFLRRRRKVIYGACVEYPPLTDEQRQIMIERNSTCIYCEGPADKLIYGEPLCWPCYDKWEAEASRYRDELLEEML